MRRFFLSLAMVVALSVPAAAQASSTLSWQEVQQDPGLYALAEAGQHLACMSDTERELIADALYSAAAAVADAGAAIDDKTLHSIYRDLAWELVDVLGTSSAAALLSLDAMAPARMAVTHDVASEWADAVLALPLTSILKVDTDDDSADAFSDGEGISETLGAVGRMIGEAVGALLGDRELGGDVGEAAGEAAGEVLDAYYGPDTGECPPE